MDPNEVGRGKKKRARTHPTVENHFQPTESYAKSQGNKQDKLTIYKNQTYREGSNLRKDMYFCNIV